MAGIDLHVEKWCDDGPGGQRSRKMFIFKLEQTQKKWLSIYWSFFFMEQ